MPDRPIANAPQSGRAYVSAGSLEHQSRCAKRLAAQLQGDVRRQPGGDPAMRLWAEVNAALRAAHDRANAESLTVANSLDATPPTSLSVEESLAFTHVLEHYVEAFGDDEAAAFHPSSGVASTRAVAASVPFELGTKVDLLFDSANGPLLRRVHLRGRPPSPSDEPPTADLATAVALRLPAGRARNDVVLTIEHLWTSGFAVVRRVEVRQLDLDIFRNNLHGMATEALVAPNPNPGWWCNDCSLLTECDAVPSDPAADIFRRLGVDTPTRRSPPPLQSPPGSADPTLGDAMQPARGVLVLSASRIRDFHDCPRRFFLAHVLRVPVDPPSLGDAAELGLAVHAELHARHRDMARHDNHAIVSQDVPHDPWILGRIAAHGQICPRDEADYLGGELDLRWLDRRKAVLVTGRIDALWRHEDTTLEIRDYKTGRGTSRLEDLEDDLAALVYLLLGTTHRGAARKVRVVRVAYELLGEPVARVLQLDADPVRIADAIELVESTADRVRKERNFTATPSASVCGRCTYREVCPKRVTVDPWVGDGSVGEDTSMDGGDWEREEPWDE